MKRIIGLVLVAFLVLSFVPSIKTFANEESTDTTTTENTNSEDVTKNEYELADKNATDYMAKLEERIAARKSAQTAKLTTAKQNRIKTRCKAGQDLVNKVSETASETKTNRYAIYDKVIGHATKLSDRLKENDQDTIKLDESITELTALVDQFKKDLLDLRQTGQDIVAMDCAADPSGFAASLESLRTARNALVTNSEAIRAYVKDSLKPVLQDIRTSIGEAKKEETKDGSQ